MKKPPVNLQELIAAVTQRFGPVDHITLITEGEESRAFKISIDNNEYILRANRSAEGFRKDDLVYQLFGNSLPIPGITATGHLGNGIAWCLSAVAPGVTLQDLPITALPAIVAPVAKVMKAIGNVILPAHMHGFGPFNAAGEGSYPSWAAFLNGINKYNWAGTNFPGKERVTPLLQHLNQLVPLCPEIRQLVHGDFGSNNVLTDGQVITGVIDWSEAMTGDSCYDTANVFFWRTWLPCMDYQAHYIETHTPDMRALASRLTCYQLRIGMEQIYQAASEGAMDDVQWALARCEEISNAG